MGSQKYKEAMEHLSTMLSLDPSDRIEILVKRSKAQVSMNLWNDALSDAEEARFVFHWVRKVINKMCRSSNSTKAARRRSCRF